MGKKLENPYAVANMKEALNNLKESFKKSTKSANNFNINIEATHLYVKFTPKNEEELAILKNDSTLILYSYPLDYDLVEGTGYYRDPEVPEGQPTYQYCSVKVGKELPSTVESEILEALFIPDEDKDNTATSRKIFSIENVDVLVDEALRITNNLQNAKSQSKQMLYVRRSKWRPAGVIRVWDENIGTTTSTKRVFSHWEYYPCDNNDVLPRTAQTMLPRPIEEDGCRRAVYKYETNTESGSYVGVEGVKVRARRWFTTHTGIANATGYYSCDGRFRRDANYSIDWERYEFALQDGWLNGATYNGPKKTGNWNLNLKADKQAYYATIFRAAHHYYYKDIKGLKRPPTNSFWKSQMKIRAHNRQDDEINGNHQKNLRIFGVFARIHIYNPQNSSSEIYATTIHELAHASHWELRKNKWNDNNLERKVKESWARGVQWELTRMVYPNYRVGATILPDYTQLVLDMIDNLGDFNNGSENLSQDNVTGYTIKQIEDVLSYTSSWNNWKENIKNKYNNGTKNNLDALFNHWD